MSVVSPRVSLDPGRLPAGDVARFWRVPRYAGLDGLRARFRRHTYARHTHETFAFAAVVDGCETFHLRGEQRYAVPGTFAVVHPDEPHDGAPHGGYFEYRTLYPSPDLLREIAEEAFGRPLSRAPFFREPVIHDPELAADFAALHATLGGEVPGTLLETDGRLVAFVVALIARHGDLAGAPPATRESRAVARAKALIDARAAEEIPLSELATAVGLSRAHLIRAFKAETGLSPHAWQIDRRIRTARRLLGAGEPPADVAAAVGFYDQSHLNRAFKARMGITPGAFSTLSSKTAARAPGI